MYADVDLRRRSRGDRARAAHVRRPRAFAPTGMYRLLGLFLELKMPEGSRS